MYFSEVYKQEAAAKHTCGVHVLLNVVEMNPEVIFGSHRGNKTFQLAAPPGRSRSASIPGSHSWEVVNGAVDGAAGQCRNSCVVGLSGTGELIQNSDLQHRTISNHCEAMNFYNSPVYLE